MIKSILKNTGMDLWTMADRIGVRRDGLTSVMMCEAEPGAGLNAKVADLAGQLDLCPECTGKMIRYGGCVVCNCGYERCG